MKPVFAFIGGALAGAAAALLLAPESGKELRADIKNRIKKCHAKREAEIDELVSQIAAEIESDK